MINMVTEGLILQIYYARGSYVCDVIFVVGPQRVNDIGRSLASVKYRPHLNVEM